jgi:hypothetical protein
MKVSGMALSETKNRIRYHLMKGPKSFAKKPFAAITAHTINTNGFI